jgi:two-component system sensor histidine kinase/response regulator
MENMEPLRSKPRILIAEDSVLSRKIAVRIIENCGCETDTAGNGREAFEKASTNAYDLIIMDMCMPDMDGGDSAMEIRKAGIKTPIVALSANAITAEEQIRYGLNDSMLKPISNSELNRVLALYCHLEKQDEAMMPISAAGADASVFDEAGALEFAGGSKTVLAQMITMFIEGTENNINRLFSYLDSYDLQQAKSAAHLIKGESKAMGVKKVFSAATEIEEAAKAADRGRCLSLIPVLKKNFLEFKETLNSIRK